jgi:signal transduction histidine kinase
VADQPFETTYPALAASLEDGADLVEIETEGTTRYFAVERERLTIERQTVGEVVVLSDVTDIEQQRQQLQQQNEQFGDLAVIVTHELRNLLTVVRGHIDGKAAEAIDAEHEASHESYERGISAVERMEQVTTDLAKLARYGQTAQNKEQCDFRETLTRSWDITDTDGMSLSIGTDGEIYAEKTYLIDLFDNAFQFMRALNATVVSGTLEDGEIVITSDGDPLSDEEIEAAWNYGEAVPSPETGMLLPMVRAIGRAHGWTIDVSSGDADSVSLHIETK